MSFRLAARSLAKQRAFTAVVVLSLALGIALNTTMYGMLDALIRPRIDMREPANLYRVRFFGDNHGVVSNAKRDEALATGLHSYEAITRTEPSVNNMVAQLFEHGQTIHEGNVLGVATNYFDVLGVRPLAGRTFIPDDERADIPPVVLEETMAARLFPNGDSPIGQHIVVASHSRVVIGVIASASRLPGEGYSGWEVAPLSAHGWYVRIIRLRAGASPQDAARELSLIAARIGAEAGDSPKDVAFRMHQSADPEFQLRNVHYALIAAVIAVLLVACANLANIQLARGISRRRELALRSALGATRRRLMAHLLNESLLLAAVGLALGLVLTYWGSRALAASIPPSVGSYIVEPQWSWRVLAFALAATTFCVIVIGVLPSISVSRADPNDLLKSGAGTGATKRNRRRYATLVGVEIALALALSSFAAVTLRTVSTMADYGFGYDARPLSRGYVAPRATRGMVFRYGDLLQSTAARVRSVPGVIDAAASTGMGVDNFALSVDDAGGVREIPAPGYAITVVSPSYVRSYGYPIVKGRDFFEGERDHGAVIVDERTARFLWPNGNPIGALIKFGDKTSKRRYVRVVGVYGEDERFSSRGKVRDMMVTFHSLGTILYVPVATDSVIASGISLISVSFVARAAAHPAELPTAIRRAEYGWSDLQPFGVATMDQALGFTQQRQSIRFIASLFSLFSLMGIGLAAFGVYGVVAYGVAERRREFGVRVALGASSRDILRAVLRESVVVALAGTAVGLLLTKFGTGLLWQFATTDAVYDATMFAGVAAVVVAAAAVSAFIPALRATRIDPTESLRAE